MGPALVLHPETPLDDGWNPLRSLDVADAVTPLTEWKLARALANPEICRETLTQTASFTRAEDFTGEIAGCGISNAVRLSRLGDASIGPVQTSCRTALLTAMWAHHGLRPAAERIMGSALTAIDDIGSYNCRTMRLSSGATNRLSSHATASAIDVAGFRFADGTRLRLIDDWDATGPAGTFLRAARDSACKWFPVTLGPDHNALHADHFHLQSTGWGLCR